MSDTSSELAAIERELARPGLKLGFREACLEQRYLAERRAHTRVMNWASICVLIVIYDAFVFSEIKAAPEVVTLSAWLRFAVLTPAAIGYVVADRQRLLGRWAEPLLSVMLIGPTLVSGIESFVITSPSILYAFQSTPLLQLAVLTSQMGVRQAVVTNGTMCLIYFVAVLMTSLVPSSMVPSLLLTDIALAVSIVFITFKIDRRDRQVFLLAWQADLGREMLAAQNHILARLSQIDALTGLGNRRCFDETLAALWSDDRQTKAEMTLVLFDIDCFKLFNDRYGHQAGDECLATLARAISRCLRDDRDTLVRYGGEEFAIVLAGTPLDEGAAVAERVRQAVAERAIPHPDAGPSPHVTVSLGVATVIPGQQSAAVLIEAADRCLYAAKRAGRNQVVTEEGRAGGSHPPDVAARFPALAPVAWPNSDAGHDAVLF